MKLTSGKSVYPLVIPLVMTFTGALLGVGGAFSAWVGTGVLGLTLALRPPRELLLLVMFTLGGFAWFRGAAPPTGAPVVARSGGPELVIGEVAAAGWARGGGWIELAVTGGRAMRVFGIDGDPPAPGTRVAAFAAFRGSTRNPGRRARDARVATLQSNAGLFILAPARGLNSRVFAIRRAVRARFRERFEPTVAGLATALVIGDRSRVPPELAEAYRGLGLSHLLAISGLHVGIVVGALMGAVRLLMPRSAVWPWVVMPALVGFAALAGGSASVVRAAGMGVVFLALFSLGRRSDPLHALSLSAWVAWIVEPASLFELGGALSYAATAGILIAIRIFPLRGRGRAAALAGAVGVSVAASVATAPILATAIGAVPLGGVLLSLPGGLAVAGAIVPLVCGLLAWPIAPLSDAFLDGAWPALAALVAIEGGSLPVYSVSLSPYAWGAAMCAGAAFACARAGRWAGVVVAMGMALFAVLVPMRPVSRAPELIVFDVGSAESMLLRLPDGEDVLIDCGREGHGQMLARAVRSAGGNPSQIVITHPHDDHDGGLDAVARAFPRAAVVGYAGDVARRLVRSPGVPVSRLHGISRGDTLWRGGDHDRLVCLHPGAADTSLATNERSVVLGLSWRGRRMLLTGDLEFEGLRRWRDRDGAGEWMAPEVELLKLGHHGSPNASPVDFIDDLRPRVAVVSTARNPDAALMAALRRAGTTYASTSRSGAILIRLDPHGIRAWGWWDRWIESPPILPRSERPGPLSLRPPGGA